MVNNLKQWYIDNAALNRTLEMFWECFEAYSVEEYEEYKEIFTDGKANVDLKLDKLAYEIDLPYFSQELISITIDIYVCKKKVGWYKQLYLINGEAFDEYFVID